MFVPLSWAHLLNISWQGKNIFFSLSKPALELYSPSEMISEIVMLDLDRPFLRVLSSLLKQAIIKISAIAEFNKWRFEDVWKWMSSSLWSQMFKLKLDIFFIFCIDLMLRWDNVDLWYAYVCRMWKVVQKHFSNRMSMVLTCIKL